jgi:hypothetical protein
LIAFFDSVFPGHGNKRWRRRDDGNRLLPEKEGLPPLKRFSAGASERWRRAAMSATELFLAAWLSNWKPPLTGNILEVGGLILLVRLRPDGYSRVECLGRELRFTLRQLLLRHQNSARPSGSLVSRRGKVRGAVAIARSAGRKSAINGGNPLLQVKLPSSRHHRSPALAGEKRH